MSVIVVATAHPVAEHRADAIAAFETAIARVHAEDEGCELYALHEGKDRLVMIEKWSSADALKRHGEAAGVGELRTALDGKLSSPLDVQILEAHPAGTAEQGAL